MTETTLEEIIDDRPTGIRADLTEFWSYFSENRGAVIGLFFFIAVVNTLLQFIAQKTIFLEI